VKITLEIAGFDTTVTDMARRLRMSVELVTHRLRRGLDTVGERL
jgi:hypothetical protein